jgi:hypothetical protein
LPTWPSADPDGLGSKQICLAIRGDDLGLFVAAQTAVGQAERLHAMSNQNVAVADSASEPHDLP